MALKPFTGELDPESPTASPGGGLTPFTGTLDGEKPKRGITGWAKDIGASTMGGLAGLAKSAGDLYGLASGNTSNALSEAGQSAQEYWGEQKSDVLKASEQQRKAKIDAADGVLDKAWTAAKETLTDPGLAVDTVASNISTLIPGAIVGRAAQGAKLAQGLAAASKAGPATEAAIAAAQKVAGKVGTAAAIGTGAVQQATDVSSDAYGDAMKKTDAEWDASPQFREALAANGGDRQAAKHALSLASARAAFVPAAAVSVAANAIPGATYLERALIGAPAAGVAKKAGAGTIAKAIGKGMLGEGTQEFVEEGGGKLAANYSTQQIADPAQDVWADVGENAGMGAAGGILLGGIGGVREGVHENANARLEAAARGRMDDAARAAEAATVGANARSDAIYPNAWDASQQAFDPKTGEPVAAPDAPDITTSAGAGIPRAGNVVDFERQVATDGLQAPSRDQIAAADSERARGTIDFQPQDTTPTWMTSEGAQAPRQGIDASPREIDTGNLDFEQQTKQLGYSPLAGTPVVFADGTVALSSEAAEAARQAGVKPSQALGIDESAGPLSAAAAQAIDSGATTQLAVKSGNAPAVSEQSTTNSIATGAQQTSAAHVFRLQNRDRSNAASVAQMNSIAAAPDYLRTGPSRTMDQGAPVVFGDTPASAVMGRAETVADGRGDRVQARYAVVEAGDVLTSHQADGTPIAGYEAGEPGKVRAVAGNGRAAGLTEGYRRGTAGAYRAELEQDAQSVGIDPAAVRAMRSPVLVRVMDQADVTPDIGDRSNTVGTQRLSPVEQAANDAARVDLGALQFTDDGRPLASSINGFVQAMPESERGDMLNQDGTPTRQAVDRLMAAVFKQAYDNDALVQLYAQATDPEARAVMSALADAAGAMAGLSGQGDFDIRSAVADAAGMAVNATRQGLKLADVLQNADLDMNPEAFVVAEFMAQNIRSSKRMADGLRNMAQLALEQVQIARDNETQAGMFGETPTVPRQQILESLNRDIQKQPSADAGRAGTAARVAERQGADATAAESGRADRAERGGQREAGQAEGRVGQRPANWRTNYLRAAGVARGLGIDPKQHKTTAALVAAIEAADFAQNQAPAQASQAQAATETVADSGEFALTSPTPDDIIASQEALEREQADRAAADAQAERRARADAERDSFTLTGSDRDADVAEARGQAPMFSRSATTRQKYEARIDALMAGGKATVGTRVLDRSDVMGLLGYPDVPMMLNERHLIDGLTTHPEMTAATWKKVPDWLENPAMVYRDPRDTGRLVAIAPDTLAGYPVMLIVEPKPNPAGSKPAPAVPTESLLVTVYAKTSGNLPAPGFLASGGNLLYVDTKNAPEIARRGGVQFPKQAALLQGRSKILTEKNLAGWRKANAPTSPDTDVRYSFAGQGAITADRHALAAAEQRISAGEDTEAVRQDTGWHQGADGKWRYEISDADARLSLTPAEFKAFAQNGGTVRLGDLLDHPKLFAAYPALADMPVGMKPGRGASYSTRTGQVTMGEGVPAPMFRSVLMHEIQHGIQTVEGFATGGAVSQYRGDLAAQRDQYRREAGEVEARNTQSRLDMGDAERRAFPPDMTADVAPGEQIVTFNGKAAQNAPMPANVMTPELARQLMALRPKMATKDSVQTALRQLVNGLGVLPNKLGRVVVATSAEIKSEWEPLIGHVGIEESGDAGQALGFYDPRTKTVFMIADHIRAGDEMAVLAHELMHKHGQDVLGEAGWNKLHSAIEGWGQAEMGSMERRVYDEAAARVRASQPEGADRAEYSSQELFPYAVQVAMELGVKPNLLAKPGTIARWLGQVKAALREAFAKIMGEKADFNSQDLVNLAFGIAQRENPAHAREMDGAAVQDGPVSGQPAAAQFSRSNTPAPASWNVPEPSWFDDKVYKLQDKHIDTKRVIEAITEAGKSIAEAVNVYQQEELFHGRVAKRTSDFQTGEVADLMTAIGQAGMNIGDVEEFLHARHAKEANALIAQREPGMQDGGSGMTNAAADAYMAKLPAADRAKLEKIADMVDGITAGTRQLYADYGLESQETVDGWGKMFQHYVPLQREDKDGGIGIGQGMSVKGRETKGRTGSTRKVVDILANVVMQRERALVRGEKNRVATALVGLATAHPNEQFWHVGTPPAERVYDPNTDSVVDRIDPMYKNRANAVVAKVRQADGSIKEVAVTFNESDPRALRMAGALKNLDAAQLEGLLGASAKITRYFAAVNTQWNPVFGMVNLVRDVQGAMINLQSTPLAGMQGQIARDTGLALAGIYSDLRKQRKGGKGTSAWAQLNEQFQQDGGQTGYRDQFANSTERAEALKRQLNPGAWAESKLGRVVTAGGMLAPPMEQARKTLAPVFNWLTDYNDAMENGVRLAAYKAALDKGLSRQQAASIAKNLTVNFNRKGQTAQQAGALYAFFNAAMQGTARIGEALFTMDGGDIKTLRLSKTGKQVVYGGMLLGTLQAMALAAAGFDDEDPPEFVRERSLIIPTGGKGYVSIPMPLGLHVIPGLGRQITEFALSGFKDPAKRAVSVMGMFADAFNPIGNAGMSMQTLAPTVLDPLVALTENKDYTGKAIARLSSNKALPGHLQGRDTSTWLGKIIAEGINYASGGNHYRAGVFSPTPDQIDYLGGQIGGGVWREASKVEQTLTSTARGEELPTYKIPLFGRFYGDAKSQASQGTAFYAAVDKANALETELKGMRKDGKWQEAMQLQQASPEAALIGRANAAERRLQELRREKRALIEKGAERAAVKAKEDQITDVMRRFNEAAASVKAG